MDYAWDAYWRNIFNWIFQVTIIIEKLPTSWKEFKNYLKYQHEEMKFEKLIMKLRIGEDKRFFFFFKKGEELFHGVQGWCGGANEQHQEQTEEAFWPMFEPVS